MIVLTFQGGLLAQQYAKEELPGFTVLVDREREVYRRYGMLTGGLWDIWGWNTIRAYVGLLLKGRRLRLPHVDTTQLGGDVIVDPDGVIRFFQRSKNPADRPPVSELLKRVGAQPT